MIRLGDMLTKTEISVQEGRDKRGYDRDKRSTRWRR